MSSEHSEQDLAQAASVIKDSANKILSWRTSPIAANFFFAHSLGPLEPGFLSYNSAFGIGLQHTVAAIRQVEYLVEFSHINQLILLHIIVSFQDIKIIQFFFLPYIIVMQVTNETLYSI